MKNIKLARVRFTEEIQREGKPTINVGDTGICVYCRMVKLDGFEDERLAEKESRAKLGCFTSDPDYDAYVPFSVLEYVEDVEP